ncbi:hypothetical protein WR25_13524 [Diploscapter pachys]|uniref:Uncharacterized protein n=1 Tax=Diploscapter pachys TaxID=2018661 RepID=A0A2A2KFW7_9BILA|nr:hypothetical protein WR25_13524 [Diploscapter pachys]
MPVPPPDGLEPTGEQRKQYLEQIWRPYHDTIRNELERLREHFGYALFHVLNGRFKGGHITRHYGDPSNHIHAVQLELAQSTYMEEHAPYLYRQDLAQPTQAVLRALLQALPRQCLKQLPLFLFFVLHQPLLQRQLFLQRQVQSAQLLHAPTETLVDPPEPVGVLGAQALGPIAVCQQILHERIAAFSSPDLLQHACQFTLRKLGSASKAHAVSDWQVQFGGELAAVCQAYRNMVARSGALAGKYFELPHAVQLAQASEQRLQCVTSIGQHSAVHDIDFDVVERLERTVVAGLRVVYRVGQCFCGNHAHGGPQLVVSRRSHQHQTHALAEVGLRAHVHIGRGVAQTPSQAQQVVTVLQPLQRLPAIVQGFVLRFGAKRP